MVPADHNALSVFTVLSALSPCWKSMPRYRTGTADLASAMRRSSMSDDRRVTVSCRDRQHPELARLRPPRNGI
jgi:hypothetical protein